MAPVQLAKTLEEAYRFCDPLRPLQGEWLDAFYVERSPDSRIDLLVDELQIDPSEEDKTLFSGQRGTGKTTELHRLSSKLQDDHAIIFLDVEERLNLGDVHYTDLLVCLGLAVYEEARKQGMPADDQQARDLLFWYEERILERDEAAKLRSEVSTEIHLGVVRFGARLSQDSPFRKQVRAKTEAGLSDLLSRLNELLLGLRRRFGRRILVIVDGVDKVYDLRQAINLFLHGANALIAPACRVIYTVPFPVFYSPDFQQVRHQFHRNFLLPNVKTRQRDGSPYPPGRQMLEQVLLRRVQADLIAPPALEALVEASGGLLRELMRLSRHSVSAARRRGDTRVGLEDVAWARREVRNTYRRILKVEDYRHLWKVYETKRIDALSPQVADQLLHNLSVLEYNGETWWDVHPAVQDLLEEAEEV